MLKIPTFWYKENSSSLLSLSLMPLGLIYGKITSKRANNFNGYKSKLPVICVGNITMGGTGKTPTSLALANFFKNELAKNVAFLTRGYGGTITEPTRILATHTAIECGDEPLLLSKIAPTYISPDRGKGAVLIEYHNSDNNHKTDVIILDDGMQNPTLQKDITLVVIDGKFGLGNNRLFPAGPLRETLTSAQSRSSAYIIIGDDTSHTADLITKTIPNPTIIYAHITPTPHTNNQDHTHDQDHTNNQDNKNVIAFAGIGMPEKVFTTARQAGYNLIKTISYGDHYHYKQSDLEQLATMSTTHNAQLLTTSKDYARLPQEFIKQHNPLILHIELTFTPKNKTKLLQLLKTIVD